jgi:L-ascorbate metabolism protein UlaG (beta-lactamase superfamily)
VKVRYLGHSAFDVRTSSGRRLLIDPFLTGNPRAAAAPEEFDAVDLVLATHDHGDHLGDSFDICKRTGATFVSMFEVAVKAEAEGIAVEPMGIGGGIDVAGVRINMVNAQHSSDSAHPSGFVIEDGECRAYFAGDTGLFGDMKILGEIWRLDLAVLPIGDRFTMGPTHAAKAVEWLRARHVIPCHYATFPMLLPDAKRFVELVGDRARVHALAPGETMTVD